MSQKGPKSSQQFKSETVQSVIHIGRPVTVVAQELRIHEGELIR